MNPSTFSTKTHFSNVLFLAIILGSPYYQSYLEKIKLQLYRSTIYHRNITAKKNEFDNTEFYDFFKNSRNMKKIINLKIRVEKRNIITITLQIISLCTFFYSVKKKREIKNIYKYIAYLYSVKYMVSFLCFFINTAKYEHFTLDPVASELNRLPNDYNECRVIQPNLPNTEDFSPGVITRLNKIISILKTTSKIIFFPEIIKNIYTPKILHTIIDEDFFMYIENISSTFFLYKLIYRSINKKELFFLCTILFNNFSFLTFIPFEKLKTYTNQNIFMYTDLPKYVRDNKIIRENECPLERSNIAEIIKDYFMKQFITYLKNKKTQIIKIDECNVIFSDYLNLVKEDHILCKDRDCRNEKIPMHKMINNSTDLLRDYPSFFSYNENDQTISVDNDLLVLLKKDSVTQEDIETIVEEICNKNFQENSKKIDKMENQKFRAIQLQQLVTNTKRNNITLKKELFDLLNVTEKNPWSVKIQHVLSKIFNLKEILNYFIFADHTKITLPIAEQAAIAHIY